MPHLTLTPTLGACVNAGVRPYLGRIRPENRSARAAFMHPNPNPNPNPNPITLTLTRSARAAFMHPYSVATAHHDPRR